MTTIRRLTDSCLTVTGDSGTTLFDPGFHTFDEFDLQTLGDVQRVLITHQHGDHLKPEFVAWLLDRGEDVTVFSNQAVADVLARHEVDVDTGTPPGTSFEDVVHEPTPMRSAPPNRAFTLDGILTHPGDSYRLSTTAPVLALPLMIPWGSTTASVEFAIRLGPRQVIPVHDFYLNDFGRKWVNGIVVDWLTDAGIELVPLNWGESYTV